jgi:hypothetical protein
MPQSGSHLEQPGDEGAFRPDVIAAMIRDAVAAGEKPAVLGRRLGVARSSVYRKFTAA